jgi:hypothetical protein
MAQDQRSPTQHIIDVAIAVGVEEVGSLTALNKQGASAHSPKSAHRRIYAARDNLLGSSK